jgi:hypothetical protein
VVTVCEVVVGAGAAGAVLLGLAVVEGVLDVGSGVAFGSGVALASDGGDVARGGGHGNRALADKVRSCASASSSEPAGITP